MLGHRLLIHSGRDSAGGRSGYAERRLAPIAVWHLSRSSDVNMDHELQVYWSSILREVNQNQPELQFRSTAPSASDRSLAPFIASET